MPTPSDISRLKTAMVKKLSERDVFYNNKEIDVLCFVGLQDVEEFKLRDYINQQLEANKTK